MQVDNEELKKLMAKPLIKVRNNSFGKKERTLKINTNGLIKQLFQTVFGYANRNGS